MKPKTIRQYICYLPFFLIILSGCKPMSLGVKGNDNKMNGSFEIVKTNLPVNWYYYTQETVSHGNFDISSDSTVFKEGKKSLKFVIRECESKGGLFSPGFFQGFKALPGETYKVSFWVINKGCNFKVYLESSTTGNRGPCDTIIHTQENFSEWKYFEFFFKTSPTLDKIRFEANILSPGTIWFDDIKIEGLNDKSQRTLWAKMR